MVHGVGTGGKLVIVKPQSFMNRSGEPVQEILNFYKVRSAQLVVIYDDCELEVGRLKLQSAGAHGGHNGIRSIESSLSTKDFLRIRVGISRPPPGTMELADWVLGRFNAQEQAAIDTAVRKCVEACVSIAEEGFVRAQNAANKN
jgi:PTH1 family peptidyl-tRNA hydrolase